MSTKLIAQKKDIGIGQIIPVIENDTGYRQIKVVNFDRHNILFKGRKGDAGRFSVKTTEWSRKKLKKLREED